MFRSKAVNPHILFWAQFKCRSLHVLHSQANIDSSLLSTTHSTPHVPGTSPPNSPLPSLSYTHTHSHTQSHIKPLRTAYKSWHLEDKTIFWCSDLAISHHRPTSAELWISEGHICKTLKTHELYKYFKYWAFYIQET